MKSIENGELQYAVENEIASITFNRPEKLNPLNITMVMDLYEILDEIDGDESIRVVVLRGAGRKAFIAGADISEFGEMENHFEFREYIQQNCKTYMKIMQISQPVIAAVNGFAFGGGCGMVLSSDIVVATTNSMFATQEISLGFPGNGTTLTNLVGKHKAAELTMLGNVFSAEEAYRLMIANRLVMPEVLDDTVAQICKELKAKSFYGLKMAKRVIYNALDSGISASSAFEADAAGMCFSTPQFKAAVEGFLQKGK